MYIVGLCSSINAFRSDFRKERENDSWTLSERSKSGENENSKNIKIAWHIAKSDLHGIRNSRYRLEILHAYSPTSFLSHAFRFLKCWKMPFFCKKKNFDDYILFFRKTPIPYYRLIAPINLQLWKISTGTILKTLLLTNSFILYSFLVIEIGRTWHHSTSFAEPRAVKQNFEKCLRLGCAKLINEAVCKVWLWYLFLLLSYWKISGVGHFGPPAIGFGNRTRVNR